MGGVEDGPLVSLPLRQFIYSLGSRSSAPGGGSASAAIAAMVSVETTRNPVSLATEKQPECALPTKQRNVGRKSTKPS